jgi:hypothetical protein
MASALRSFLSANSEAFEAEREDVEAQGRRTMQRIERTNDMIEKSVRTYMAAAADKDGEFGEIVKRKGFTVLRSTAKVVSALLTLVLILQGIAMLTVLLDPTRFTRQLAQGIFGAAAALMLLLLVVSAHNYLVARKDQDQHSRFMRFGVGKTVAGEISALNSANEISATGEDGQARNLKDFIVELTGKLKEGDPGDTANLFSLPAADKLEDDVRRFRGRQAGLFLGSLFLATGASAAAAGLLAPEDEAKEPSAEEVAEARRLATLALNGKVLAKDEKTPVPNPALNRQLLATAPIPRAELALFQMTAARSEAQGRALAILQSIRASLVQAGNLLTQAAATTTGVPDTKSALRRALGEIEAARDNYAALDQKVPVPQPTEADPAATAQLGTLITSAEQDDLKAVFAAASAREAVAKAKADLEKTSHKVQGGALVALLGAGALSLTSVVTSWIFTSKYYGRSYLDVPKFYNRANNFLMRKLRSVKTSLAERIRLADLFQMSEEATRLREIERSFGGAGAADALASQAIVAAAGGLGGLGAAAAVPVAAGGYAGYPVAAAAPVGYVPGAPAFI